jgi:hypothetical protein
LQKEERDNVVNILQHMVERAGDSVRCVWGQYRKKKHWFDEGCVKRKRETRNALRDFRGKNGDTSRIKYLESRKLYEKILEDKRNIWQAKEAVEINKLVRQKEVKKLREAIKKLVREILERK